MSFLSINYEACNSRPEIVVQRRVSKAYSVQFPVRGSTVWGELKVWHKSPSYMSLLVEEDSEILPRLKVGDDIRLQYYAADLICPSEDLETQIRKIKRNEGGKLKGSYLVELEILKRYN